MEVLVRYLLFAGAAWLLFYTWKNRPWNSRKIQRGSPKPSAIRTEIAYSMLTVLIFGTVIWFFLFSPFKHRTNMYYDLHAHSIGYFFLSILLVILLHDTYFYWTHRLMHWKKIFRYVHHIHHKSYNPTPWAAYAFHPVEAVVEIGVVPIAGFLIPLHPFAFAIFGLYMILMNVMGHLGYELFPQGFMKSKWTNWYNSSTHHNMHHHYSKSNYGLYFNIWDKLMKTNHPKYAEEFLKVAGQKKGPG